MRQATLGKGNDVDAGVVGEIVELEGLGQLAFDLPAPTRKRRKKPGRKRTGRCSDSPHRTRPAHAKRHPVHVVLRTLPGVPRLRRGRVLRAARQALRKALAKPAFRVVHVSLQHNHVHFLVEAADRDALRAGMQGLAISLAKRINRACGRRGKLFAHRYHATTITSPTQTRNALAYVLNNWRRHREDRAPGRARIAALDPYASGLSFDGWRDGTRFAVPNDFEPLPVARAETWLLTVGWRTYAPPLDWREVPARVR
jgi:REP element-mobilizing transposase RayT